MEAPLRTPVLPRTVFAPRYRDPDDPRRRAIELAQRGRMILDVAAADLEASEASLGPFHATTWHFRNTLAEARRSWDQLRAEFGQSALDAALAHPPVAIMNLGDGDRTRATLIQIMGKTYRAESVAGTEPAPVQWRLTRLPKLPDGPYYVCRLRDGSTQCDCADWVFNVAQTDSPRPCKHLAALAALGWL